MNNKKSGNYEAIYQPILFWKWRIKWICWCMHKRRKKWINEKNYEKGWNQEEGLKENANEDSESSFIARYKQERFTHAGAWHEYRCNEGHSGRESRLRGLVVNYRLSGRDPILPVLLKYRERTMDNGFESVLGKRDREEKKGWF